MGFSHLNHGQHGRRGTIDKKSDRSVYIYYHDGLIATAWSNEAASITGNRGINQSTGRRGWLKIDGCSRKRASSGSQLSSEEPKHGRITSILGAISRSSDDRGRSSEIKSDDRAILRFTLTSQAITSQRITYWLNSHYITTGNLLNFYRVYIETVFSHLYVAQEAKNRLSRVYPASLRELIDLPSTHLETHLRWTRGILVEA